MNHNLLDASRRGIISEVRQLISNPNVDINYTKVGDTAFLSACKYGHKEIVQILLDTGFINISI